MYRLPYQGSLMCGAELRPVAHRNTNQPPSPQSIELGRVVDRGIRESGCIDMSFVSSLERKFGELWLTSMCFLTEGIFSMHVALLHCCSTNSSGSCWAIWRWRRPHSKGQRHAYYVIVYSSWRTLCLRPIRRGRTWWRWANSHNNRRRRTPSLSTKGLRGCSRRPNLQRYWCGTSAMRRSSKTRGKPGGELIGKANTESRCNSTIWSRYGKTARNAGRPWQRNRQNTHVRSVSTAR